MISVVEKKETEDARDFWETEKESRDGWELRS